jgi:hypothetical protein
MNKEFRGKLIGTLLGDASIHFGRDGNSKFQFTHQEKQKEYAFMKAFEICKGFKRQQRTPNKYTTVTPYGEVTYYKFYLSHKYNNFLHRVLYSKEGKKYFSLKVLNYLTPEGIAWWYMDDGGVSLGPSKDKFGNLRPNRSVEMRISTYCTEKEADNIIRYFYSVWGLQAKKRFAKKTSSYYIAFSTKEGYKLEEIISPFILPYFKYKLPSYYNPRVQDTLVEKSKGEDIV